MIGQTIFGPVTSTDHVRYFRPFLLLSSWCDEKRTWNEHENA